MTPFRIQRRRTKGWKMPPNTAYVGRPGPYGNPFHAGYLHDSELYCDDPAEAVWRFWVWLRGDDAAANLIPELVERRRWILAHVHELRGKNLVCWCPLDRPCHADVLLEIANAEVPHD